MFNVLSAMLTVWIAAGPRGTTSASFALAGPTGSTIASGSLITVAVRSTHNERIAACAYQLTVSGGAIAMTEREVTAPLRYLATTPINPYGSQLPRVATNDEPLAEVLIHINSNGVSGDANDGLAAGTDVTLATYSLAPIGIGSWSLTLSSPRAAETQTDPDGALFDDVAINPAATVLTLQLTGGPDVNNDSHVDLRDFAIVQRCMGSSVIGACMSADIDADGDVDSADFRFVQNCLSGPASVPTCGGA